MFINHSENLRFKSFMIAAIFLVSSPIWAARIRTAPMKVSIAKKPTGTVGSPTSSNGSLNLGALIHDGPPTPEQLSLYLPLTGAVDLSAKASVLYRKYGDLNWIQAHPLHRLRPDFAEPSPFLLQGFAGVIFDLSPGVEYEVQVSVSVGSVTDVRTLRAKTRALPTYTVGTKKIIHAGSNSATIAAQFGQMNAGDVIEFENGTYDLSDIGSIEISRSGTETAPIVIRGASRDGVIIKRSSGKILYFVTANHIIVENLTLEGPGIDSGTASASHAIQMWTDYNQKDLTFRNLTIRGVDQGIVGGSTMEQIMVYNCTLQGNNKWDQDFYGVSGAGAPGAGDGVRDGEQNVFWDDDGIRIPGHGNVAFNNSLNGFGDALAVNSGLDNVAVHFYRNDITMTGDDGFEGDYGVRNMSFYDNRIHNAMTFVSFDPMFGGPVYVFRNIAINIRRGPYKLNSTNTGLLIYNNTIVTTNGMNGDDAPWAWVQYNNGPIQAWSFRNNILIRRNVTKLMALESDGNSLLDFTNNAWYPDGAIWWTNSGRSFNNLADSIAGQPATTPLYGTSTHRHDHDLITEANPFDVDILLGVNYRQITPTLYLPRLKSTSPLKSSGVAIPGITDGFTGVAPDMGAVLTGRPVPIYGDK